MANPDLVPDGSTYCNFATQNILKAVASATTTDGGSIFNPITSSDIKVSGLANQMLPRLDASNAFVSVDQSTATATAQAGGLAIAAWANPTGGHGHIATFSVGIM